MTLRTRTAPLLLAGVLLTAPAGVAMAAPASSTAPTAAATGSSTPAAPAAVLTVGLVDDVTTLNPFSTDATSLADEVVGLSYERLTTLSANDFAVSPGLAQSWSQSLDGRQWTFTLREARWSDGTTVTAADAKATIDRIVAGELEQQRYGADVQDIDSVSAPDARTLVITVKQPTRVPEHLTFPILPAHVWDPIGDDRLADFTNLPTAGSPVVGSGPFLATEVRPGEWVRLTRNPQWTAPAPHLSEVIFRTYPSPDAVADALGRGEIDVAEDLTPALLASLAGKPGVTAVAGVGTGFTDLALNTGAARTDGTPIGDGNPALRDQRVRAAVSKAVDRAALVQTVLGGRGAPGTSVIPPAYATWHWDPGPSANPAADTAGAAALLDAAGYRLGGDGRRAGPDGTRLTLRLFARQEAPDSQQVADLVRSQLDAVGIGVDVTTMPADELATATAEGKFDLVEYGWDVGPDPTEQLAAFTCAERSHDDNGTLVAGLSDSFYCDPTYDEIFDQQSAETDPGRRATLVATLQRMLYDAAPYVVTAYPDTLEAYRSDRVGGFVAQPAGKGRLLFQQGSVASYLAVTPVAGAPAAPAPQPAGDAGGPAGSGTNWALIAAAVAVAILLVVAAVWWTRRDTGMHARH
ncbi:MAG: ABC transporter substrate-binding protein [Actinomycetota bacterium]|nr:MAG: ABC transporter substrate-binding protein [Actinomycetota bacterium]